MPDFTWKNNPLRANNMRHPVIGVQVDAMRQIRAIRQMAAIKSLLLSRIQEVDIIGFANLRQTVFGHALADALFFDFRQAAFLKRISHPDKIIFEAPEGG